MTVLKEGAAMAQMGWIMGVMTIIFTAIMVAWILWTWWPGHRAALEAASMLPFDEED